MESEKKPRGVEYTLAAFAIASALALTAPPNRPIADPRKKARTPEQNAAKKARKAQRQARKITRRSAT